MSHLQIAKDWVLFAITILVVTVDLLIILIGTAMPSSRLNAGIIYLPLVLTLQHACSTLLLLE